MHCLLSHHQSIWQYIYSSLVFFDLKQKCFKKEEEETRVLKISELITFGRQKASLSSTLVTYSEYCYIKD